MSSNSDIIALDFPLVRYKTQEELIQEKIMESEMRVASQMGLDGSTFRLPFTSTTKYSAVIEPVANLSSTDVLSSLGFSPSANQKLNNALSGNSSTFSEDNS